MCSNSIQNTLIDENQHTLQDVFDYKLHIHINIISISNKVTYIQMPKQYINFPTKTQPIHVYNTISDLNHDNITRPLRRVLLHNQHYV